MVSVYGSVNAGQSGTLQFPPITFASSGTDGLTGPLPLPELLSPIDSEADSHHDETTIDHVDLEQILSAAVDRGASDVHLKAGRPPIVRFDGELEPLPGFSTLGALELEQVVNHVGASSRSRLAMFEHTGELDTAYQAHGLPRFRVNAFRQRGEISLAFRVIPRKVPDFESLRLPPGVETLAEEHRGLILVTGATGVGKTTTLAAMIGHINRTRRQHIVTIEDPIEFLHDDETCIVNQREVGIDTDSFNEALRRVLRQDPDVILIGEMRDRETAETALQAAESGHLVLSTMHTVDAAETLGRLVEFFPAIKQPQVRSILAGVLRGRHLAAAPAARRRRPHRSRRGDGREHPHPGVDPREQAGLRTRGNRRGRVLPDADADQGVDRPRRERRR